MNHKPRKALSRKTKVVVVALVVAVLLGSAVAYVVYDQLHITNADNCRKQEALRQQPPYPDIIFSEDYCQLPPNEAAPAVDYSKEHYM